MGDSHNGKGDGFHQGGNVPLDHSSIYDQHLFLASSYNFMDPRPVPDAQSQYGPELSNNAVQHDSYQQRGFYGSGPNHFHGGQPPSANSRHSIHGVDFGYSPVEQSIQQFHSLQAPELSFGFNGHVSSPHAGEYDFMSLPYDQQHSSHQLFDQTVTAPDQDEDNQSVGSVTTDCDSQCDLEDACTGEECASEEDACKDKECPGAVCTGTDCPEKMAPDVVSAAATLATFAVEPPQQQSYNTSQPGKSRLWET